MYSAYSSVLTASSPSCSTHQYISKLLCLSDELSAGDPLRRTAAGYPPRWAYDEFPRRTLGYHPGVSSKAGVQSQSNNQHDLTSTAAHARADHPRYGPGATPTLSTHLCRIRPRPRQPFLSPPPRHPPRPTHSLSDRDALAAGLEAAQRAVVGACGKVSCSGTRIAVQEEGRRARSQVQTSLFV